MPHRVFVVEDHPVVREGYLSILRRAPDLEVCGEAEDGLQALDAITETKPDIAVIDLSIPGINGLELIKQLQAIQPELQVLVVSAHDEAIYAERALRAGARGYIMKHRASRTIIEGIRQVLRGDLYLSEPLRASFLSRYLDRGDDETSSPLDHLTDRELETFQFIGQGLATKEIAAEMKVSPKTIDTYRAHLKDKLGTSSSAELLRMAVLWVETGSFS